MARTTIPFGLIELDVIRNATEKFYLPLQMGSFTRNFKTPLEMLMHSYLPIMWEGEGLKKRCRSVRTYVISEFVEVEIQEVDEIDAPISVNSNEVAVRYFNERHWYPFSIHNSLGPPKDNEPQHKRILSDVSNSPEDLHRDFFLKRPICPDHPDGYYVHEHLRTVFNSEDFREINLANRDRAISSCFDRANSLILIGGYIWHSAASPVLLATLNFQGSDRWSISVRVVPMDAVERKLVSRPKGAAMFELETDREVIRKILPDATNLSMPEYEVLMPEVMKGDIAARDFAYCVDERLIDWWTSLSRIRTCEELNVREVLEFGNVLSALKDYQADRNPEKVDFLESVIKRTVESGFGQQYFDRLLNVFSEIKMRNELIDLSEIGMPSN